MGNFYLYDYSVKTISLSVNKGYHFFVLPNIDKRLISTYWEKKIIH